MGVEREMAMTRTYTITKGQQYDRQGASIRCTEGRSESYRSLTADGKRDAGSLGRSDDEAVVMAAALRVIETGVAETIVLGTPDVIEIEIDRSHLCPRCHTMCHGDCARG
jgi:hypothetical protein